MDQKAVSPPKKPMSQMLENINSKTSITCTNVPEVLFEPKAAEKHFSKFGKVQKICLLPKKQKCIVEYHQTVSAERAVLNAGAYDGFMFDVTRTKPRVRTRSKREEDPEWLPDEDLQQELSAMSGLPIYRLSRQKPMELDTIQKPMKEAKKVVKRSPISTMKARAKPVIAQPASGRESPPVAVVTVPTTLTTAGAAEQLHQLRSKISLTPDDQWRILDARDRILRSWGGAGSRVKVGGATIGTCPDMCPEKERLHRQAEHQVMTLETEVDSDGKLEPAWAIKQYSRSSADQEMPMCYELRPPRVLLMTAEHLRQIADTPRQVTLADWFHFMWDRFRSIRKDITQQALCCADSIRLVEICARFHAHCGARLADLEHTQFDQKLNTDNLTKCLQTLKHMYADVQPHMKPNEAEFRGYIALLNLGDANFWWEVKQLPQEIQKSKSVTFALEVFAALDNNNYVKFFRLVREEASYLQACILLRYFNDVRARALARIVKAYAPKGGFLFPGEYLMKNLAFENVESMKAFITHYGLRFAKSTEELSIVLNRMQFIEDSDPFPLSRAVNLIESKRKMSVGDVICGGKLLAFDASTHNLYSSFNRNGTLKETALLAEDLGYNTINDTNIDIKQLKAELAKLSKGNLISRVVEKAIEPPKVAPSKPLFDTTPRKIPNFFVMPKEIEEESFSFQPAIPVASNEEVKLINEKIVGIDKGNPFTFSKPQQMEKNVFSSGNLFTNKLPVSNTIEQPKNNSDIFNTASKPASENFKISKNLFEKSTAPKSIFGQATEKNIEATVGDSKNIFVSANKQILPTTTSTNEALGPKSIFSNAGSGGLFTKPYGASENSSNIFTKFQGDPVKNPTPVFGSFKNSSQNAVTTNGDSETTAVSPGSLFKSVNQKPIFPATTKYSIFQSKNKAPTVAESIFSSVKMPNNNVYDFDQKSNESFDQAKSGETDLQERAKTEEMERLLKMQRQQAEEKRKQEELRKKQEEQKRIEELKRLEEEKRERERKQAELKKKLEEEKLAEERKAEEKRKAEKKRIAEENRIAEEKRKEKERLFRERVKKESDELVSELQTDIVDETVRIMLQEEIETKNKLFAYAEEVCNEFTNDLVNEICMSEMKAEIFRRNKVMKKWFHVWRNNFIRNYKRRSLLEDTPIWLTDKTPQEEAVCLRRSIEKSSLKNMNAFHRGYKFSEELNEIPAPKRFNLVDIIRSSFLKRMKEIQYPYDKCFFWKLTIISPESSKWIYKRINVNNWITSAFSDKKEHATSKSLLYVGKESWNNLMDFAISVSMFSEENPTYVTEAIEGSHGILHFVADDRDIEILEEAINNKHSYQVIPVAVMVPDEMPLNRLKGILRTYKSRNIISDFSFFTIVSDNLAEAATTMTRKALRWLARNYPRPPPLEIDCLKSICQRYLGNEIWCRLKYEPRNKKNLVKLILYYNEAVSKLTEVITNEDLFNYSTFPLELKNYLNDMSPYPKPYEFISSNVRNYDNICAIKRIMERLKLPTPRVPHTMLTAANVQEHVQKYCQQIGWFENPEEVACKIVALLPEEASIVKMPYEEFSENYHNYDLIDVLNVIVYEKIKDLHNFDNTFAIYLKPIVEEFRNFNWLHDVDAYSLDNEDMSNEDEIDFFIEAKRRKVEFDSMEPLMLEDKDCTMVEESIERVESNIKVYNFCEHSILQLERALEEEKKKSEALENMIRLALYQA